MLHLSFSDVREPCTKAQVCCQVVDRAPSVASCSELNHGWAFVLLVATYVAPGQGFYQSVHLLHQRYINNYLNRMIIIIEEHCSRFV